MTVHKRDVLAKSAIVPETGDQGSEGTKSPHPSSHGALGSEDAHGDSSLAAWKANLAKPGLGEQPSGDGSGYAIEFE